MSSPQIQLRRSTRKSILPSSQVKSNVNKLTPILIPVKHQTPIAPRSIQEFTGDFKKLSDDFKGESKASRKGKGKFASNYFPSLCPSMNTYFQLPNFSLCRFLLISRV